MKIEVGKTYLDGNSNKILIVSDKSNFVYNRTKQPFVGVYIGNSTRQPGAFDANGYYFDVGDINLFNLVKEWKEPVVHKRDVIWYEFIGGGFEVAVAKVGEVGFGYVNNRSYKEVKRQTVEFNETDPTP
jgi:hypothetical protein